MPAVVSLESDVESTASIGTNGSVRTRIGRPVLKKLFYEIEHAGGIQVFDKGVKQALNVLLDKGDPVIYGFRGDKIRKRLTCKVYQWKKLPRDKYLLKLSKLGVQSAEALPKASIVKLVPKTPKTPIRTIPEEELVVDIPEEIVFPPDKHLTPRIDSAAIRQRLLDRKPSNDDDIRQELLHRKPSNVLPSSETFEATMKGV